MVGAREHCSTGSGRSIDALYFCIEDYGSLKAVSPFGSAVQVGRPQAPSRGSGWPEKEAAAWFGVGVALVET